MIPSPMTVAPGFTLDFLSSLIVRFHTAVTIESIFLMTRLICLTSSSGEGFSLNLTVLINALGNLVAKC